MVIRTHKHKDKEDEDYRTQYVKDVIIEQGPLCPISFEYLGVDDCEIVYVQGVDYAISKVGIKLLKDYFGDTYIENKIVSFNEDTVVPTEDQVVHD